nr:hypothetical protein [uncultured Brevundimonas sp.]
MLDLLTVEANYCDTIVTRNGVTEARYRCAGNYPVNTEPQAVREAFLATFDSWMSLDGRGRLIVKAGRYVEPTFILTSEHIQGYSWRAFQTEEEARNVLVVSILDPEKDYTEVEAGTMFDKDDIDDRNGVERPEALQLPWCPSSTQGMELARRKMTSLPYETAAPITLWTGLISLMGALGLGGVLTALASRPSRRAVAATAAKDEATGEAAVIGALANAFTDTTASLRKEIERMQNTLNEFRERVAEAEGEVRAVLALEAIKDRLIADQKVQLEIAHQDVIRLRSERDAAMDKAVQQEGEIRQLKAVIEAHDRARN